MCYLPGVYINYSREQKPDNSNIPQRVVWRKKVLNKYLEKIITPYFHSNIPTESRFPKAFYCVTLSTDC